MDDNRVWVMMNGDDKWLIFGAGKPVETNDHLVLFDSAENVIGKITLTDLRGWRQGPEWGDA